MKALKVPVTSVLGNGEEVEEIAEFHLLPAPEGTCQECGIDHPPEFPHDAQRLHYQYSFYAEHGRWPTWADAMAHCDEETKAATAEVLKSHGIIIETEQEGDRNEG